MATTSTMGNTRKLDCKDLHGYLCTLSSNVLDRLYNHPATCLAVFRELPPLGKQYVMRLVFVDQPIPCAVVASWVKTSCHDSWASSGHLGPDKHARDVEYLDSYALERWECVLHFLVGSRGVDSVSRDIALVLNKSGLMKPMEEGGTPVITQAGFQFLLMDTPSQVWYFMLQYLQSAEARNLDLVEALNFLFQLSFSSLGKDYSTENLNDSQLQFLQHLRELGLVFQRKRKSKRYYPSRLAINLASGLSNVTTDANRTGFIMVETNYRVYAYTDSNLQVEILGLFTELLYRLFFPKLTPIIPPTISDQIRLWELERDRLSFTDGVLYNQFLSQHDFEVLRDYAKDIGVLNWENPAKRVIIVSPSGHDEVKRFWKRQKKS
uniref:General transcription factor IIH subunit 4 n=1 Tax=Saccoglossus kowalevskii TaxID=10224 RepID=A0ABM0MEI8_SACKO|nr:PREDICTED: general transcription factor IIH subunit 4-like [Saccoglossus kowalevskii]